MGGYRLELSPAAYRDLKVLPHEIQKSIAFIHLPRIAEQPYNVGKPLMGSLHGEKSYQFGRRPEYRIIYSIEEKTITVTVIGSREGIYKKAKSRK
jgi:mRNA-degrading endonuclease RelE of RelBE toxin-antitoxin system